MGDALFAGHHESVGRRSRPWSRGPAQESALQKIIHLIQTAQRNKAPAQRFTDQFGTRYTYAILALTLVMFFVWWLALGHRPFVSVPGNVSAFYHAMTLLVVASPCALVLSIPSAILAAIAWGARRGILFRGGAAVEQLAEVKIVAMDKTGTLTTGDLRVEKVESFPPGREREVAQLAVFARSPLEPSARPRHHPPRQARGSSPRWKSPTTKPSPALGSRARHDGETVRLGRRKWVAGRPCGRGARRGAGDGASASPRSGLERGDLCGRILLRDDLRPEARAAHRAAPRAAACAPSSSPATSRAPPIFSKPNSASTTCAPS